MWASYPEEINSQYMARKGPLQNTINEVIKYIPVYTKTSKTDSDTNINKVSSSYGKKESGKYWDFPFVFQCN